MLYLLPALYEKGEIGSDESKPNHLIFAISSDRGLCGSIHSGMAKAVKAKIEEKSKDANTMLVLCGDKVRGILQRTHGETTKTYYALLCNSKINAQVTKAFLVFHRSISNI